MERVFLLIFRMSDSSTLATSSPKTPRVSKPQKAKRQKSAAEQAATAFLRTQLAPFQGKLRRIFALDVLAVLLLVLQMACLAKIVAYLLTNALDGRASDVMSSHLWALIGVASCLLLRPVLFFWRDKWLSEIGDDLAFGVRKQLLDKLALLGLAKNRFGADGALASLITREPDALHGYARFFVQKMTAVATPLIIAIAIACQSLLASALLLITAPLVPIFMALIGIKTANKSREQLDALADLGGRFLDWLRGSNSLVRLGAVSVAGQDIAKAAEAYKERTMSVLKIAFLNSAVLEFLSALSIALVAVYLGFGLLGELPFSKGTMLISYEAALFILLLVPEFYAPLRRLGADYHIKGAAEGAAKALAPLMAVVASEQMPARLTSTDIVLREAQVVADGRVRLAPTSLRIAKGERWAIMGASGSGKSTLFALLLGFVPYTGQASIGGNELLTTDMVSLRRHIGYLPQTPALLPLSIADNLRLANPDATDAQLQAVLEQVGLWTLIEALPKQLATPLNERGGGLSGGQAQRLAIAQLLLQEASIWLLDEPSEHLDEASKAQISALLARLSVGKTLLWATHDTPAPWLDGVHYLGGSDV